MPGISRIRIFHEVSKATGRKNQVTWKSKSTVDVVALHLLHQVKYLGRFNIFF